MDTAEIIRKFLGDSSWSNRAKEYLNDKEKTNGLLQKFQEFLQDGRLAEIKDNMLECINYVRDIISGKYKDYSVAALLSILAGIIYVVSPIDIIPDFLPIAGMVDDAAVFLFIVQSVNGELEKYRKTKS